nr:hypothetical protein [Tanacetum cinerariifolium]
MEHIPLGLTCPKLNIKIATKEAIFPRNADHQGTTGKKKLLEELSQCREEPTNYALMAYTSPGSSCSSGSDNKSSSKNLCKLLESQVSDKTGLGLDSQVFNCQVSDCEELHRLEVDNRVTKNQKNDKYKTGEVYHVVPPPYTRNFLPPKLDLVFTDDTNASELVVNVINVKLSEHKTSKDKSKTHRPDAPIIEY